MRVRRGTSDAGTSVADLVHGAAGDAVGVLCASDLRGTVLVGRAGHAIWSAEAEGGAVLTIGAAFAAVRVTGDAAVLGFEAGVPPL